ncbi:hypothetical protein H5410_033939 [Solanum commersonii]|uniref:Uncharacterized protein n=1 Tax=Solanum commersonii TaxID=4109 RepID=A0A9J5YQ20_SOLCO|nr:hypothetical protein H5410_033939 [Solanum commersonii]
MLKTEFLSHMQRNPCIFWIIEELCCVVHGFHLFPEPLMLCYLAYDFLFPSVFVSTHVVQIYKAQRNVILCLAACLLYWCIYRVCKYYKEIQSIEEVEKRYKDQ